MCKRGPDERGNFNILVDTERKYYCYTYGFTGGGSPSGTVTINFLLTREQTVRVENIYTGTVFGRDTFFTGYLLYQTE